MPQERFQRSVYSTKGGGGWLPRKTRPGRVPARRRGERAPPRLGTAVARWASARCPPAPAAAQCRNAGPVASVTPSALSGPGGSPRGHRERGVRQPHGRLKPRSAPPAPAPGRAGPRSRTGRREGTSAHVAPSPARPRNGRSPGGPPPRWAPVLTCCRLVNVSCADMRWSCLQGERKWPRRCKAQ